MRSAILLAAANLVAGSPANLAASSSAAGAINLAIVNAAPTPSITGPDVFDNTETGIYNSAAASSSAVAAVTGVATASATAAQKRNLEGRTFCFFGFCLGGWGASTTPASPQTTTSTTSYGYTAPSATTASKTTYPAIVTTSAPLPTTSNVVPSSCTPISWTNTNSFTSDSACPTPYEVGTYCGFVNPEDPCAPQPDGYGPKTYPDTAAAFKANPVYHSLALTASASSGYIQTFKDLNASVNANSYMGLYTLQSYDVASCAAKCDNTNLCTAFNLYIERDPAWNPDQCSCTGQNVASITNFKCTLWGSGVQAAAATNFGESRDGFEVVIAGSNGYAKTNNTTPATPPGWTKPGKCSGGVHVHPSTCISEQFFAGVFDVSICATYAAAQNAVNVKAGIFSSIMNFFGYNSGKCNFFNAFMLTRDGVAQGTYCKLFAQQYDTSVAINVPGWLNSHYYGVESSWSFCSSS